MAVKLKKFYKGFSTRGYEENGGSFSVYNVQCVEEDLMNAIFTEVGQRKMIDFGTRIPLMTFEPGDQASIDVITQDLMKVFNNDPRVQVLNLDVIPATEKNALIAVAKLNYLEFLVTKDLMIEINQ